MRDLLVDEVIADVAAPDHADTGARQVRRQARGLRVVQDRDVAGTDLREQPLGVVVSHLVVDPPLLVAERAAVAGGAVQRVMQPLRECEEGGRAFDHEPARVDAEPAGVAEQRGQHLRHAAAGRGRVHVPDDAALQLFLHGAGTLAGGRHDARADDRLESLERERRDVHLVRLGHACSTPGQRRWLRVRAGCALRRLQIIGLAG